MADVILTTSDLKHVRKLLYPIRRKWYDIGLELDINVGDLDTIKATCSDPGECLTEMVKMWLKCIASSPTWKSLGDALKADFVDELELAQKAYAKQSNLSPERDAAPHSDLATQRNQDDSNIEDNSCLPSASSMASLFPERLYDETTKIQTQFASLMLSVQKDLEKTVKTEDVISFLVFRNKKLVGRFDNCTRIPQVFRKIIHFISFFDYDLLEDLIKEFGSETVREKLKKYLELFEVFSKRRVFECPILAFGNAEESEKVWVLKTDKIIEDLTVEELKRYVYKISKILDKKLTCVLRVEKGCVKLTFKSLEDDRFDISEKQIQALNEIGIMNVSYGDRSTDTGLKSDLESIPACHSISKIEIDGEEYSLIEEPAETSALVAMEKKDLEWSLHLKSLVTDLAQVGSVIRIAYYAVAGAYSEGDTKMLELQLQIQSLGYDIAHLCSESVVTVLSCTTRTILQKLSTTFQYLLDGLEDKAIDTLFEFSTLAGKMAATAQSLHEAFDNEEEKINSAVETVLEIEESENKKVKEKQREFLHHASVSLKQLSVVMIRAAFFCRQLQQHCQSLADDGIKGRVERAMKFPETKRLKVWTSRFFKRMAVIYYAKWVALHAMCHEYMGHIQQTQEEILRYIREKPTREESRRRLPDLIKQYIEDLEKQKENIKKIDIAVDEEIKMLIQKQEESSGYND